MLSEDVSLPIVLVTMAIHCALLQDNIIY